MILLLLGLFNLTYGSIINSSCTGDLLLDVPVRHLFIQLDEKSRKIEGEVEAEVDAPGCVFRHDIIDRNEGSYVFRLKLISSCPKVRIKLKQGDQTLCGGDIVVERKDHRNLYGEDCKCPRALKSWMDEAACETEPQIQKDLKQWKKIDFATVLENAKKHFGQEHHRRSISVCHYQIMDGKVYRHCFGEYDGFKMFVDKMLYSVLRKMRLPNTEFLFNLGDFPLARIGDETENIPIFSWCGSTKTRDIVVPSYEFSKLIQEEMNGQDDLFSIAHKLPKWEDKTSRPIFRGRDSNKLRIQLARISDKNPDLVDAGITRYFFHDEDDLPKVKNQMALREFFKHRYIISIDGTVAAYRLPLLLAGNSVVLKSDSNYYEHFYSKLQADVHYIPFNEEDVEERLLMARTDWFGSEEVFKYQRAFADREFTPKKFYCYMAELVKLYTLKLINPPSSPASDMELAADDGFTHPRCECFKTTKTEL